MNWQWPGTTSKQVGLAIALICWGVFAQAASFTVSPVRVALSPAQKTVALTVTNNGSEPVVVQSQVQGWSQQDGEEIYTPTSDVLATPPIFTVQGGASQIIRIGLRKQPDSSDEQAYRLFLREVPGPPRPDLQGLQIALRMSIPVFVNLAGTAAAKMRWHLQRQTDGSLKVSVANAGNAHAQVYDFYVFPPDSDRPVMSQRTSAYILPGQRREWVSKPEAALALTGNVLRLKAFTDAGNVDTTLTLDKP